MGRKPDPNKKNHIIQTAAGIFARKGYAGTRIIAIAEAAGIGKGTIYEYFSSKEDLFFAVFHFLVQHTTERHPADSRCGSQPAADRIANAAKSLIETWLPRLDLYSLVMEFWSAATTLPSRKRFMVAIRQEYANMRTMAAELIQQGVADGEFDPEVDPENISAAMVGALDSLLLQAWLDPEFDVRAASDSFVDVMLKGLQRPSP